MGTNYYLVRPLCPTCGQQGERIHVGRSAVGWTFMFRIYPDVDNSPFDEPVRSRMDWKAVFWQSAQLTLEDQHGRVIENKVQWLAELQAPDDAQLQREQVLEDDFDLHDPFHTTRYHPRLRDPERFRVNPKEFS